MPNRNRRSHVRRARHPKICIRYRAPRASSTKSRQIQIKLVKLVSITVAWCITQFLIEFLFFIIEWLCHIFVFLCRDSRKMKETKFSKVSGWLWWKWLTSIAPNQILRFFVAHLLRSKKMPIVLVFYCLQITHLIVIDVFVPLATRNMSVGFHPKPAAGEKLCEFCMPKILRKAAPHRRKILRI